MTPGAVPNGTGADGGSWGRLEAWARQDSGAVPFPGEGRTWERFAALASLAGEDLVAGRLGEGHLDALAILHELGAAPGPGLYGVWAAHRNGELVATPTTDGWSLTGTKPFCSGAGHLDRALVVADAPDGTRLFDLDVRDVEVEPGTWPAVGMAGSDSYRVCWQERPVGTDSAIGAPGAYTDRPGFWWGAAGVAACWWGGARALLRTVRTDLHSRSVADIDLAELGRGWAGIEAADAVLRWAAVGIDGGQDATSAHRTALVTRQVVHQTALDALAAAAAAGGARPVCLDPEQSRRSADLYAYLAQHHGGRDAALLGRLLVDEP